MPILEEKIKTIIKKVKAKKQSIYDKQFSKEILVSEVLRVKIFVIFFGLLFIQTSIILVFSSGTIDRAFNKQIPEINFVIFFGLVTFYYMVAFWGLSILRKRDKDIFPFARYINAVIEGFIPTIALILFMPKSDPASGLAMPPLIGYSFFIVLSIMRLEFFLSFTTGLSAAISYLIFSMAIIGQHHDQFQNIILMTKPNHVIKAAFLLFAGIIGGFVASQLKKRVVDVFNHIREKQKVEDIFGTHVSPEVMQKLMRDESSADETRVISVMFLDIRGFTTFSENKTAKEVYDALNQLFEFMLDIIQKNKGVVNKFLGDGFLAIFGAPEDDARHCYHAVNAATEILATLESKKSRSEVPNLDIGIGIHTGSALVGNVGSEIRKEYTVIGDVVNLASRIETANKKVDSKILISAEVYSAVVDDFSGAKKIGHVKVKGREKTVVLYKLA